MIKLRHLRLRSVTASRVFGADIPLGAGLNVVQAPNTSGKSTCLQAIVYGLGLERSLGPQLSVPLPYAMRERIHETKDEPYEIVLQSYVELEIENQHGDVVGIHRDVVGGKDTKLVQTWAGPWLSQGAAKGRQRDFYVHDAGAASRADGFHTFVASFLGWDLPTVPRFDGTESPLYLEAIFPMLFVEQKRGWSAIQGPFPTFLKIQDVARRVMEFLLDLDAARNRRERSELRAALAELVSRWNVQRRLFAEEAARIGRVHGVPAQPSAEFAIAPSIELELYHESEWERLGDVVARLETRILELEGTQIETVEDAAPTTEARMAVLRARVDELSAVLEAVRNEHGTELQELRALEARVSSLQADLKRNQDAQKLQRLGSDLGRAAAEHVCPTCHQAVTSELLPAVEGVGMGLEENIVFVKSQIDLYQTALAGSRERVNECEARYHGMDRDLRDKQQELRSLRQELVRPSSSPSRSTIEEIVRLQAFADRLRSVDDLASSMTDELKCIAGEWVQAMDRLRRLPSDELTQSDRRKIDQFEQYVRKHLERYGFRSFQPSEICLSRDNFRPLVTAGTAGDGDGGVIEKEINFEISASDAIRLKWSYYLSAMELSGSETTNHPKMVIFDEPGQQEIEASSLYEFLTGASLRAGLNEQIIVSTSETLSNVQAALPADVNVVSFEGFILQPFP